MRGDKSLTVVGLRGGITYYEQHTFFVYVKSTTTTAVQCQVTFVIRCHSSLPPPSLWVFFHVEQYARAAERKVPRNKTYLVLIYSMRIMCACAHS